METQTMIPSLIFKDAAKAMEFYKKSLGAKEEMRLHMPGSDRIMHASMTIGGTRIFLSDENVQWGNFAPGAQGSSVGFYLYVENPDEAQKKALSAGMKEVMPVSDTFWGDRMGAVEDPFGYKWNLAVRVKTLSMDELHAAMKQAFGNAA